MFFLNVYIVRTFVPAVVVGTRVDVPVVIVVVVLGVGVGVFLEGIRCEGRSLGLSDREKVIESRIQEVGEF